MIHELLKPAVKEFILANVQENPAQIALKHREIDGTDIKLILEQILARKKAAKKLPSWAENPDLIFPDSVAVEQSSSFITAEYKASLFSGKIAVDLTGGLGIDTLSLALHFEKVIYIDADANKCEAARHNFTVLKQKNIDVLNLQGEDFLKQSSSPFDLICIDPDRRPEKERVFSLEKSTPDVVALQDLLLQKGKNILIKSSPMLDITAGINLFHSLKAVHAISVQNECKEVLLHLSDSANKTPEVIAALTNGMGWILFQKPHGTFESSKISFPKNIIYEPDAAVLKAGLQDSLAKDLELGKLHPSTQLFTSDQAVENYPGRRFKLIDVLPVNKKIVKQRLPQLKANLSTRNFPEHVDNLKKKLNIKDGGNYYLFACRLADLSYKLLVTEKI